MLSIPGIKDLKKTLWKNLEPGMIFLGGVVINDTIPYELRDYPVLTAKLLSELSEKFKFLENREVVIAEPMKGFNARKISEDMSLIQKKLKKYQDFSSNFQSEKRKILEQLEIADPEIPILNPEFIEPVFLIKDHFNSMEIPFTIPSDGGRIPSFLSKETASIRVSELFSNVLNKKLNLPDDKEILLHIVVDYSFSMNNNNKLEIVIDTVHSFYREISEFLLNTKINLYVFSNECKLVQFPLSGKEIAREETNYSSFMKKVLHHKDKELNNLVLVFTDGKPGDFAEAIQNAEKLKRNKIDYIQILLAFETDDGEMPMDIIDKAKVRDGYYTGDATKINKIKRSPDEIEKYREKFFGEFSEIAKRANGNQAILKINDVAKMVSIEFFDRYVGILSMATPKEAEAVRNEALQGLREFSKPVAPPPETGPKIRAWSPKKL